MKQTRKTQRNKVVWMNNNREKRQKIIHGKEYLQFFQLLRKQDQLEA